MTKFAERLKELREEAGLSMRQLSAKIGFTDVAIGKWEKGLQVPNIDTLNVFADFFGVSADYLLGRD